MSVREGNERIMITLSNEDLKKLEIVRKFLDLNKSKTIIKLIDLFYVKLGL